MAWEDEDTMGGTMITVKMNSLPDGVNLRWPHTWSISDRILLITVQTMTVETRYGALSP